MRSVDTLSDTEAHYLETEKSNDVIPAQAGPFTWQTYHMVEVRLVRESDGRYSVHVPVLPGVASFGSTEQEALQNIQEALEGAIETYKQQGMPIPWRDDDEPLEESEQKKWVQMNV